LGLIIPAFLRLAGLTKGFLFLIDFFLGIKLTKN
jgi:hypothetical protein